jgi:beta-hydroxyacyl-ACP dehydratase FabZ
VSIDIQSSLDRLCYRYPSPLVDAITEHEPGRRITAVKNVTVNEDFFQGHFPGSPLMPGVLMIETLAQVATILLTHGPNGASISGTWLRGVDNAKFRLPVVPGDRLTLEVTMGARRARIARAKAVASINGAVAAEAELVIGLEAGSRKREAGRADVHPTAIVHPGAQIGAGTVIGPYVTIGERVTIGRDCDIGASCVIDGVTTIGDGNRIFPMASIGLVPQDLKFGGEPTRVTIGDQNVIREFVTIHRGTAGGGGLTSIGSRNLLMAYTHIAHDCHVGNSTIFGNAATLAGHVLVEDFANVGAFSGVHQFVHRRLFGRDQGRAAVCQDRRQPRPDLWHQYHRPDPPRLFTGRHHQAAPRLPHPAAREHQPRHRPDRARSGAAGPRSRLRRRIHPLIQARGWPAQTKPSPRGSRRRLIWKSGNVEIGKSEGLQISKLQLSTFPNLLGMCDGDGVGVGNCVGGDVAVVVDPHAVRAD